MRGEILLKINQIKNAYMASAYWLLEKVPVKRVDNLNEKLIFKGQMGTSNTNIKIPPSKEIIQINFRFKITF